MTDFRVFVTGSRNWIDPRAVHSALDAACFDAVASGADVMVVVHGGARGADEFAHIWCDVNPLAAGRLAVVEEIHRPDRKGNGRSAGFICNDRMAKRSIDICLAFIRDDSKGAIHALGCARKAGVATRVWRHASA